MIKYCTVALLKSFYMAKVGGYWMENGRWKVGSILLCIYSPSYLWAVEFGEIHTFPWIDTHVVDGNHGGGWYHLKS